MAVNPRGIWVGNIPSHWDERILGIFFYDHSLPVPSRVLNFGANDEARRRGTKYACLLMECTPDRDKKGQLGGRVAPAQAP